MQPSAKKSVNAGETTPSRRLPRTPDSLSHTPGGNDETRALVTQIEDAAREYQLTTYFQDFTDWFRQQDSYQVELLQLYNLDGLHGQDISLLGPNNTQTSAIAQLRRANHYFYFCELLAGGRAALLYRKGFLMLMEQDFADLFNLYKANGLDWLKCKQSLSASGLARNYEVHPRNRHNGGLATALRCDKLISQLLAT